MSNRTRSAGDLDRSLPEATRPITPAFLGMVCLVLSLCAPAGGITAAAEPEKPAFQYVISTAYSSSAARPSPGRSSVIIVSDEDDSAGQPKNAPLKASLSPTRRMPTANPSSTAPRASGSQNQLRSQKLGSTSLFSGLPDVLPQPSTLFSGGDAADGASGKTGDPRKVSTGRRPGSTATAGPANGATSSDESPSPWRQLFGWGQASTEPGATASAQPAADSMADGPNGAGNDSATPSAEQSLSPGLKPIRLPAVLTPDQKVSGLWGQVAAKDAANTTRSSANTARYGAPAGVSGVTQASMQQARPAPDAQAISTRLTGLIDQFAGSSGQPARAGAAAGGAGNRRPAVAPPSSNRTTSTAQQAQQAEPMSNLWLPMTMTQEDRFQTQAATAATNGEQADEESTPSLLLPFYLTNNFGGQQPSAGERQRGETSSMASTATAGGAFPVAYLQDSDEEPLPQPKRADDDQLMPEDLGIPGEPAKKSAAGNKEGGQEGEEKEGLAEADSLGEEPPDNSLQFLRFETVLLEPGERQFDIGLTYAFSEQIFPVVLTDMGTIIDVEDAQFRLRELEMPLEVRYGLFKRVQLFIGTSVGWSNAELTVFDIEAFDNDGGLGDVFGGLTFQFRDQSEDSPYVVGTIGFTAPTGDSPFGTAVGLAPSGPAIGEGFWSVFGNLLCIRTYDPLTMFYGAGVAHSFEHEYIGLDFKPGNEYSYFFGLGFAVNDRVTLSTRFAGAYVEELDVDGVRIPGTIQEPMSIRFATTIAQKKKIVEPFVEFGLTEAALNSFFGVVCTY